jgi:hypothetical protein
VTILNPYSLSTVKTRANPGKRSSISTYLIELDVRKLSVVSITKM